jgi:hypothetical protein
MNVRIFLMNFPLVDVAGQRQNRVFYTLNPLVHGNGRGLTNNGYYREFIIKNFLDAIEQLGSLFFVDRDCAGIDQLVGFRIVVITQVGTRNTF